MTSATPVILAHDIGTSGSKSSLVDTSGAILFSASAPHSTQHFPDGRAEQNPEDWWAGVCANTKSLMQHHPALRSRVAAIGVSGHMLGLLAINSAGQPLHPCLIHSDSRAASEAETIARQIGPDRIYQVTGNILDARSPLAKMLWLKRNHGDLYQQTHRFLQSKDFITGRLTGRFDSTDFSDAAHAQWLDLRRGVCATDLLTALSLDPAKLPTPYPGTHIVGQLSPHAAAALDLPAGIPVVAGAGDGACASAGAGTFAPGTGAGETYCCIGTTAWIASTALEPFLDPQRRVFNLPSIDGKSFGTYGTVQSAGRAVQWIMDLLHKSFDQFDDLLRSIPPGSGGLTFLPYLEGERSPIFDPHARGVFFGLTPAHTQAHLLRATVEGVSFALSSVLQTLRESRTIPAMRLIGGGAQSLPWQEILADACEVQIQVLSINSGDATSLGAAIAAGVGAGLFPTMEAAAAHINITRTTHPTPTRVPLYQRHRALYEKLYQLLKPAFLQLRDLT